MFAAVGPSPRGLFMLRWIAVFAATLASVGALAKSGRLHPLILVDEHGKPKIELDEGFDLRGFNYYDADVNTRQAHPHINWDRLEELATEHKLVILHQEHHDVIDAVIAHNGETGWIGRVLEVWRDREGEYEVVRLSSTQKYDFVMLRGGGFDSNMIRVKHHQTIADAARAAGITLVRDPADHPNGVCISTVLGFEDYRIDEQCVLSQKMRVPVTVSEDIPCEDFLTRTGQI
jgi:hypothetical protein